MLKISDISEFHLIKRLESVLLAHAVSKPGSIVNTSIGDDAAVISATDAIQVVTTDTMVENVHFRNETTTMIELVQNVKKWLNVEKSFTMSTKSVPYSKMPKTAFLEVFGQFTSSGPSAE